MHSRIFFYRECEIICVYALQYYLHLGGYVFVIVCFSNFQLPRLPKQKSYGLIALKAWDYEKNYQNLWTDLDPYRYQGF